MQTKEKLLLLRKLMKQHGVDAYLIPSSDPHQDEYIPSFWERRAWFSGFTGSAGDVIVTADKAALWTDGRYFLQAEQQLSGSCIALMKAGLPETPSMGNWLTKHLKKGKTVGFDPQIHSAAQVEGFYEIFKEYGIGLKAIENNLVDEIWKDRPTAPSEPIQIHSDKYAGEKFQDKIRRVRSAMKDAEVNAHVISSLDCIAWLLNIRGADIDYNPMVISYVILTDKKAQLFVDLKKITPQVKQCFSKAVEILPYETFERHLGELAKGKNRIWIDKTATSQWVTEILSKGGKLYVKESPIVLFKAMKNKAELDGMIQSHIRDGAAMVKFLVWLESEVKEGKLTEISAADKLEEIRTKNHKFAGLSFDTISGYAEHGAIIHYRVTKETNKKIKASGIYLLDSGAQYLDGTTDITRTVALGKPNAEQREMFTRVLKGHIAIATACFPLGTSGRQLDSLARKSLWDAGKNYGHGTGHGVGAYLSVHEGPASISDSKLSANVPLREGMVLSNEPGFYKAGSYGIRIENLVYVAEDKSKSQNNQTFLKFENLTLCPIDTKLIEKKLLQRDEVLYLNAYHATVRKVLTPFLDKREALWLLKATRPI